MNNLWQCCYIIFREFNCKLNGTFNYLECTIYRKKARISTKSLPNYVKKLVNLMNFESIDKEERVRFRIIDEDYLNYKENIDLRDLLYGYNIGEFSMSKS